MLKSSQLLRNFISYSSRRTIYNAALPAKSLNYQFKPTLILNSNHRSLCTSSILMKKARVSITFSKVDGTQLTGIGKEGESLLDVVVNNELDIPGYGACEGTLSCSTCHIIFKEEDFKKLKIDSQVTSDEELDMLDLAPGAVPTSRLGCQITVTKDMGGLVLQVPAIVQDQREFPVSTGTEKQSGQ